MRNTVLRQIGLLAIVACVGGGAYGQTAPNRGPTQTVPTPPSVKLTMDHKHVLKENLLKSPKIRPEEQVGQMEPGAVVPTTILLHAFPHEIANRIPQVRQYNFFLTQNAIVLVQPRDRKIVDVIKG